MKKIKNILFDLGGIFIEIDFNKTKEAFAALGVANFDDLYTQHTAASLFEKLETGIYSANEFYDAFRKNTQLPLPNQQIQHAWNAMLGTFPLDRLEWLNEIRSRYRVYLYSNTNIIHHQAFQEIYKRCTGRESFDEYFIKAHYSHELGLRKPYAESFTQLLALENLAAHETLFVDDTPGNIEGAAKAGLQTILLAPPKTVFDLDL